MPKQLKITLVILAITTFFLVSLGSFVRATGAGLSCPDWPLCFGRVVPHTFEDGVFQEWAHRGLALIVSLGTTFFAFKVFARRDAYRELWLLAVALLAILFVQVILGGLTVIMKLNPFIVTSHLLFGTLFFQLCSLAAFGFISRPPVTVRENLNLKRLVSVLTALIFVQIIIGGFVGSSGASLVCPDIPMCLDQQFLPSESSGAQILHMTHRSIAVVIAFAAMLVAGLISKSSSVARGIKPHAYGLVILILLQVVVGLLNVYLLIPISVTVLHLALGELILLGYLVLFRRL